MKSLLLVLAVAWVGCGEKSPTVEIADPIVEKAIRSNLKKPTGELTEADLKKVTRLRLSGTNINDAGLKELVALKNLTHLRLSVTKITNVGLQQLVKLKNLREIALIASDATASGVNRLQKKMPECRIYYQSRSGFEALMKESGMELVANKRSTITDPIVEKAIRKTAKKPTGELTEADLEKVTRLGLATNGLTEVPKELENLTQLTSLRLRGNDLTDVKGLEKLTQLTVLNLIDNPDLTKAQIAELQKALPKCKIYHDLE